MPVITLHIVGGSEVEIDTNVIDRTLEVMLWENQDREVFLRKPFNFFDLFDLNLKQWRPYAGLKLTMKDGRKLIVVETMADYEAKITNAH